MDSETVAHQGFEAVMKGEPLYVNGAINRFFALLGKLLPNKRVLRMVANNTKGMELSEVGIRDKS